MRQQVWRKQTRTVCKHSPDPAASQTAGVCFAAILRVTTPACSVSLSAQQLQQLRTDLDHWAIALGFSSVAVSAPDLRAAEAPLRRWLAAGMQGCMDWYERSLPLRLDPEQLVPGTVRVISVTLPYGPADPAASAALLDAPAQAYVSRYALGRDYHKALRTRLARLATTLSAASGLPAGRVFCDSAPVLEVELARQAGLGWRGKHTLLLNRQAGSWFFLAELFTSLPLPVDAPVSEHCGRCTTCIDVCPTGAIVAPYQVDARRCISYLTIEHPGSIPAELRRAIGNRIYGCDDCQLFCPWNRDGPRAMVAEEFSPRHDLDRSALVTLFGWSATEFEQRLQGSPIRRIGHARWLRNIAVALGNGPATAEAVHALRQRLDHPDAMVREHVTWALAQLTEAVKTETKHDPEAI